MTQGKTQSFYLAEITERSPVINNEILENSLESEYQLNDGFDLVFDELERESEIIESQIFDKLSKEQSPIVSAKSKVADFVDKTKDPQHYLNRYYSEPTYKIWFDRNYPDLTIEEAVGYSAETNGETISAYDKVGSSIIPKAQAMSATPIVNTDSEDTKVAMFLGGLGVLFGAVYGVKRKVDSGKKFSLNTTRIKKKFTLPISGSNPIKIIQTRLAKWEITIEEYEKLKQELAEKST